jgi:hypothetical protein
MNSLVLGGRDVRSSVKRIASVTDPVDERLLALSSAPTSELVDRAETESFVQPRSERERSTLAWVVTVRIVFSSEDDHPLEQAAEELLAVGFRQGTNPAGATDRSRTSWPRRRPTSRTWTARTGGPGSG